MENELDPASHAARLARALASTKPLQGLLLGLAAALPLLALLRGFTVDDALITARVASHWSTGVGYRFNTNGPPVDAVTPLGFVHLLALPGSASTLEMFERARLLGAVAWAAGAALLGHLLSRAVSARERWPVLALVAVSAPLAAWASSGMETGLITLLGCCALLGGPKGALAAGIAAALRPELLPWAFVLGVGRKVLVERPLALGAVALCAALTLGPALAVALVRYAAFGSPAPLALLAKPSDLSHGARYALGAFAFGALPLLLIAPRALLRADAETRLLVAAALAHFAALVLAGGDWMALFRLLVPVLPTVALAGAKLGRHSGSVAFGARVGLALASSLFVLFTTGLPARHVLAHRLALIERAAPVLNHARVVATLDAGWVGAATSGSILDLAGVTDPVIAALPGGHTSKRVHETLLIGRGTDMWVLLLAPGEVVPTDDWRKARFARSVEQRLAALPIAADFKLRAVLPLGGTRQSYVVVAR